MSGTSMSKRCHRVLVTLTDFKRQTLPEDNELRGEIKILDKKSLLLRIQNAAGKSDTHDDPPRYYRQMEVDAMGFEFEPQIRTELSDFLNQVFRLRTNGSLLRFAPKRNINTNLLTRLLVTEVDKLMMDLRCRLKSINVDYFDVRKFDMVNLITESTSVKNGRRLHQSGKPLPGTRELFTWLINDFVDLRGRGKGDDYLDFEFVFRNAQQVDHKVHIALFQIFKSEQRPDMAEFFRSLHLGRLTGSTLLHDCLRESFDLKCSTPAVVLFELPMTLGLGDTRRKILKLSDVAYSSLSKAYMLKPEPKSSSQSFINLRKERDVTVTSPRNRSPQRSEPDVSLANWRRTADEDSTGLAYWYGRIDRKFTELKLSMEQHFVTLYKRKSSSICSELQFNNQEGGGDRSQQDSTEMKSARKTYIELLKQFQKLEQTTSKTSFAPTLKIYIRKKNNELAEAEKSVKQREIDNMRLSLMQWINPGDSQTSLDQKSI
ncbi:hypothetical protein KR009_002987 [Drosophila setifemur]|nr:hypothetical protein KR009_002987 [Drosophila setifemur]